MNKEKRRSILLPTTIKWWVVYTVKHFYFYGCVVQWFTTLACTSKREVIGSNPIMVSIVRGVVLHLLPGI